MTYDSKIVFLVLQVNPLLFNINLILGYSIRIVQHNFRTDSTLWQPYLEKIIFKKTQKNLWITHEHLFG